MLLKMDPANIQITPIPDLTDPYSFSDLNVYHSLADLKTQTVDSTQFYDIIIFYPNFMGHSSQWCTYVTITHIF